MMEVTNPGAVVSWRKVCIHVSIVRTKRVFKDTSVKVFFLDLLGTPTSIPPTETPSVCSGTACATMQCIIQYIESHFQSLFACSTAVPCVNVLCSAGDGSSFDLTILECKQPAAVRVVTRNTESVVLFNRTLSHSEIVTVPLGIDYILNATIQHLNDGTILGLQVSYTIAGFCPHWLVVVGSNHH